LYKTQITQQILFDTVEPAACDSFSSFALSRGLHILNSSLSSRLHRWHQSQGDYSTLRGDIVLTLVRVVTYINRRFIATTTYAVHLDCSLQLHPYNLFHPPPYSPVFTSVFLMSAFHDVSRTQCCLNFRHTCFPHSNCMP